MPLMTSGQNSSRGDIMSGNIFLPRFLDPILISIFLIALSPVSALSVPDITGPSISEIQAGIQTQVEIFEAGMKEEDLDMVMGMFKNGSEVDDYDLYIWMENDALEMFDFFDEIDIERKGFDIEKVGSNRAMTTIEYDFRAVDTDTEEAMNITRVFLWLWEKEEGHWKVISVKTTSPEVISSSAESGSTAGKISGTSGGLSQVEDLAGDSGKDIISLIKELIVAFLNFLIGILQGESSSSSPAITDSTGDRDRIVSDDDTAQSSRGDPTRGNEGSGVRTYINDMEIDDKGQEDNSKYSGGWGQILSWEPREFVVGKAITIEVELENIGNGPGKFTLIPEFRDGNDWDVESAGTVTYILEPKEKKTVTPFTITARSQGKYLLIIKMYNEGLSRQDYAKSNKVSGISR